MKKLIQTVLGCIGLFSAQAQSAFTPGNLVVLQTSGTASKASSQVTLKEFTTGGVAGLTVAIPVTGPTPLQSAGIFGGSEGFLTTSTDGKYLVVAGYATTATIADITASTAATAPRAVGLVYPSGFYLQYDTSTSFYSANDIRGAVSDGTNFWAGGASNTTDGIDYYGPGPRVALDASANPPKAYGLRIFNGQLYFSTQKAGPTNTSSQLGIFALGTGLPATGSPTVTQIINTGTIVPEDFSFNPAGTICYIAINLNTSAGGIQKWTKSGTAWSLAYTLGTGIANTGAYGLVADYSGPVPVIYATTFDAAGNRVIKITDNGSLATATTTTLVAAATNVYYKGITFAPVATGLPMVNLSVSKDTASEAAASVITVTASTSAPVTGSQSVLLSISGAGITPGDYTLSNATITIPDGATSGSVTFTVINDILGEGTEKADLTISNSTAGMVLGMRPVQHVTIYDNDGNNHPSVVMSAATTNFIDGGATTAPASPFKLSGVINDPTDPARTLGVLFNVTDLETAATALIAWVTSSNTTVVPAANLQLTGTDSVKTLKITPAAVGYSNITLRVTDGTDTTAYIINYAASAASVTPASTFWHTGMSDASDGVPLDDSYYISGDDELNVLNVYSRSASGLPLKSFDYTAYLGLPDPVKPEVDLEAAAVSPVNTNRIYWLGSMSNAKSPFDNRPNRDRIFATNYSGTGAATTFTFAGYSALRASIVAWGDARGYNFSASAAAGVDSKSPSGFAAEGMVFGPDSTTLYIGLRAPLVPTATRTKAVIAPITNFETWFNGGSPVGSPAYGAPIELDLGGRGIRDITRLTNGTYVIIAGNAAGDPITSAIYKWTGKAADAPVMVSSPVSGVLNLEGVMQVNTGGALSLSALQVITDQGDDVFYNDGTAAKDFGDLIYRKFRSDLVTTLDLTTREIDLKGNGASIVNGDTTPSIADNTDFGDVSYGATTSRTFAIQNTGNDPLTVSGISLTGANAGDFNVIGGPTLPLIIPAHGAQLLTVQFHAPALGVRAATLNITSNDADEATYTVALRANGVCRPISAYSVTGGGALCTGDGGVAIGVSSSDTGTTYQLYNGAVAAGMPGAGTGSAISFSSFTTAGTYTVVATDVATACTRNMSGSATVVVNPLPAVYTVSGGGAYCAGGAGVSINLSNSATGINYQLYNGTTPAGTAMPGTGAALTFAGNTIAGAYTIRAVNATTGCTSNMTGSAVVNINPLPVAYAVTGGGAYCAGAAGVAIGLAASNTDVTYQLYNGATATGTAIAGTGAAISYGVQTAPGTYTVLATNTATGCTAGMSGSATVVVNALPAVYNITGGGSYCAGNAGVSVGLDGSATGISYILYNGTTAAGSAVAGTGAALSFGLRTAGTYTVQATNTTTGCTSGMATAAVIVANALPVAYSTTGGGAYCAGGTGVNVNLNNSDTGINYQLYNGATATGAAIAGTGAAISYGVQTASGTYTVLATNTATGCMKVMSGSAAIVINPLLTPSVMIAATPGDTVCAGTHVSYSAMAVNGGLAPAYQWKVNGANVSTSATYSFVPVNGNVVTVKLTSSETCAVPATAADTVVMRVITNLTPSVTIAVAANDTVCRGSAVLFTAYPVFGGTAPAYTWYLNGLSVASTATYSYTPADGDIVYAEIASSYRCLVTTVPSHSNNIRISVTEPVIPSVTIITNNREDTFTAVVTNGVRTAYQWYKGSTAIAGATTATLVSTALANNDSVTCTVTNTDACHYAAFNSVIYYPETNGVMSIGTGIDVAVMPNPSRGTFAIKGSTGPAGNAAVTLEVTNMLGQTVYRGTAAVINGIINEQVTLGSTAANGVYLLSITAGAEHRVFHIIVAQ